MKYARTKLGIELIAENEDDVDDLNSLENLIDTKFVNDNPLPEGEMASEETESEEQTPTLSSRHQAIRDKITELRNRRYLNNEL